MAAIKDEAQVFLYDHPLSSYAQKVRIALREKGISFKAVMPDAIKLGKPETAFREANPKLEVPTLVDGDVKIFDSTIIMEYIEEKWPGALTEVLTCLTVDPPFLPKSPAARANARMIEDVCDTTYEAINWGYGEVKWFGRASGELAEKLMAEAEQQIKVMQSWLTDRLGSSDYLNGERFGWADIAAAPYVNRSIYYGFLLEPNSPLSKWYARILEQDSIKATFAEYESAVPAVMRMAPAFLSGERKREYRDHRLEWMIKSGGLNVVLDGMKANNIRFGWPDSAHNI